VFDHTGQVIGAVSAAALVYLADEEGWAAARGNLVRQAAAAVSHTLGAVDR
jgi:DNA-binding IclR family transcriptional regulator